MTRFLLLIALAALGGCATTSSDYYRDGSYYGDAGYSDGYYQDDGYYADGYYDAGYAGGDYYYGDYYGSYGYGSDYLTWPTYYSIFWPINHWYVDPFYYPGYYYGVTYFPRNYWSLSHSWGNSYYYGSGWSHGGYLAYSPYRYSWADNYYDWYPWHRQHSQHRDRHDQRPRYGSARNEAERVMALRNNERGQLGSAAYRGAGVRSNALSSPDRRGPRAAYYPSQQSSNAANVGNAGRSARSASMDRNRAARDELLRNAEYRRTTTGKPNSNGVVDRRDNRSLERGGAGSLAKPAVQRQTRSNSSTMAEAAQEARSIRRDAPPSAYSAPSRIRYSNSVRAAGSESRSAATVRSRPARDARTSRSATPPSQVYRSSPLPATRSSAPASRQPSYRAPPRAAVQSRYSQPAAVGSRSYPVEPRQQTRSAPSPVRSAPSGNSYRAPPAVFSQPAPPPQAAPSGDGRSSSTDKSSNRSSSRSRVRAARSSRSGDD